MRHPDAAEHLTAVDQLLTQAESKLSTSGTDTDLAYLETEQARAALLHGDPDAALDLAGRALGRLGTQPRAETADTLLVLAQAQLDSGDHAAAAASADQLELTLLSLRHSRPAAHTWRGLADIQKALGNHDAAYRALEHALDAARDLFADSQVAKDAFGEEVVDHYLNRARIELDAYEAFVTDWEKFRGFERL